VNREAVAYSTEGASPRIFMPPLRGSVLGWDVPITGADAPAYVMPPLRGLAVAGAAIVGGAVDGGAIASGWFFTTEGAEDTEVSQRKFPQGNCANSISLHLFGKAGNIHGKNIPERFSF
jgi:hypothetical protein